MSFYSTSGWPAISLKNLESSENFTTNKENRENVRELSLKWVSLKLLSIQFVLLSQNSFYQIFCFIHFIAKHQQIVNCFWQWQFLFARLLKLMLMLIGAFINCVWTRKSRENFEMLKCWPICISVLSFLAH